MKILPQTKAAKIRSGILIIALIIAGVLYRPDRLIGYYVIADKQEGDIVFQSLPEGELTDAIETISSSEWSHCGILLRRNGEWCVAEAIGAVQYTSLYLWIIRGRGCRISAYRVAGIGPGNVEKLNAGIGKMLGRPYDFHYAPDDEKIYCSELVYKVYDRELGIKIGEWQKLGDLNWQPRESFIRSMENGNLPLDREMITPIGLTRSDRVSQIY